MTDSSKPVDPTVPVIDPVVVGLGAPPGPGSHLAEVVRYYTETAKAWVDGWDLELIPLSGKNPRVNGDGWQTLASADPRTVLDQTRAASRVDGFGALMNRHIAFDVDHPEFLPPGLQSIFAEGLQSSSRPGRTHYIFRVPEGMRFGGSKTRLDPAFGVLGKWGEIKAWNGQIRIWSPNPDDGSHVALVPGEIPLLPPVLVGLLLPPLAPGEMVSANELDDWLDEHTEARHMSFLGGDIARLRSKTATTSKYEAMNGVVFHMSANVAAGAYPGWEAYDGLLSEYKQICEDDDDWDGERLKKYQDSWRGAAAKQSRDPELIEQAREKRKLGGGVSWDPAHDEGDQMVLEFLNKMRVGQGLEPLLDDGSTVDVMSDMSDEHVRALMGATETRDVAEGGSKTRLEQSSDSGSMQIHTAGEESSERDEEPVDDVGDWVPRMEADDLPSGPSAYDQFRERLLTTDTSLVLEQLKRRVIADVAADEYSKLLKGSRGVVSPAEIELDWQEIREPEAMRRTDGVGLVYLGGVSHELVGDAACGKTTLALLMCVQLVREGHKVVWIDFEMGKKRLTNWLMRLGATREEVNRFILLDFIRDEANLADALEWMRGPGESVVKDAAVVVVDSMSRAINRIDNVPEGVENSSQAVIQLTDQFISKVNDMGVSTVVLDHTGHMEKHRARGSSAKRQQTDVSYSVEILVGWSASSEGANLVTSRKDRDGYFVADEAVCVGRFSPDLDVTDERRRPVDVVLLPPTETAAMAWMVAKEDRKDEVREKVKVARKEEKKATLEDTVRDVIGALSGGERKSSNEVSAMVIEVVGACRRSDVQAALMSLLARSEIAMEQIGQTYWWSRK